MSDAIRWLIEHKQCSGFPQCWAAAPPSVREPILAAWGADPWPLPPPQPTSDVLAQGSRTPSLSEDSAPYPPKDQP